MLETKKLFLSYQGRLILCHREMFEVGFYDTKPNDVCAVDKMLELSLVVPSQTTLVLRTTC